MGKKSVSWNDVEDEIRQYCKKVLSNVAGQIRDELTQEAQNAIEDFYNDYNPLYYHRHYWNFYNNSFKKYYSNAHGVIFRGGVELTPQNMSDIYKEKPEWVFDSVYAGFHGIAGMFVSPKTFTVTPRMNPSPMEMLLAKRDNIVKNIDTYVANAEKNVK